MFIAITGIDGSGKSTISRDVVRSLLAARHPAERLDRWDMLDRQVCPAGAILVNDKSLIRQHAVQMPNPARFLFLTWSISLVLAEHRDSGATRVFDGYWMKHAAAEIAHGVDAGWAEAVADGLPRPDAVVYLRVSPEEAWKRRRGIVSSYECGMDVSCSQESFVRHQGKMSASLDQWADRYGWHIIDAVEPRLAVLAKALAFTSAASNAAASAGREYAGHAGRYTA